MDEQPPFYGFETLEQCQQRRKALLGLLRSKVDTSHIVDRLELHDYGLPCSHPACPICMRTWRVNFILNAARYIRTEWGASEGQIGLLVWVPPMTTFATGDLHEFDLRKFKDRFSKCLVRAHLGNSRLIGAVDLSLNEFPGRSGALVWQPQIQAVGLFPEGRRLARNALRERTRVTHDVPRPIKIIRIQEDKGGLNGALGYSYKPFFQRRVSYVTDEGKRQTRKLPLKPQDLLEAVQFLHRQPSHARIFTFGVVRKGLCFQTFKPKGEA